jgi:hypothetical protein
MIAATCCCHKQDTLSVKVEDEDAKLGGVIILGRVAPRGWKGNTTKYGLNPTLDLLLHLSLSQSKSTHSHGRCHTPKEDIPHSLVQLSEFHTQLNKEIFEYLI